VQYNCAATGHGHTHTCLHQWTAKIPMNDSSLVGRLVSVSAIRLCRHSDGICGSKMWPSICVCDFSRTETAHQCRLGGQPMKHIGIWPVCAPSNLPLLLEEPLNCSINPLTLQQGLISLASIFFQYDTCATKHQRALAFLGYISVSAVCSNLYQPYLSDPATGCGMLITNPWLCNPWLCIYLRSQHHVGSQI